MDIKVNKKTESSIKVKITTFETIDNQEVPQETEIRTLTDYMQLQEVAEEISLYNKDQEELYSNGNIPNPRLKKIIR